MTRTSEMPRHQIANLFEAARKHLRKVGHHKGWFVCLDGDQPLNEGAVCVAGALNYAVNGNPEDTSPMSLYLWECLGQHIRGSFYVGPMDLANWNDNPDRTQEDVEWALREVAAEFRY